MGVVQNKIDINRKLKLLFTVKSEELEPIVGEDNNYKYIGDFSKIIKFNPYKQYLIVLEADSYISTAIVSAYHVNMINVQLYGLKFDITISEPMINVVVGEFYFTNTGKLAELRVEFSSAIDLDGIIKVYEIL